VWVYQVRERFRDAGERSSHRMGGHRRSRVTHLEMAIRSWTKEQPDLTLAQLCERVAKQGVQIKPPALWHQLDKWKLSLKKTLHASEQERDDLQQARREWQQRQSMLDPLV
jgi:transposase